MITKGDERLLSHNKKSEALESVSLLLPDLLEGATSTNEILQAVDGALSERGLEVDSRHSYSYNGIGNNKRFDIVDPSEDMQVVGYLIANTGLYEGVFYVRIEDLSEAELGYCVELRDGQVFHD